MVGLGEFRSHSTGHSLVQPGENLDQFTLRLPEGVRKEVLEDLAKIKLKMEARLCALQKLGVVSSASLGLRGCVRGPCKDQVEDGSKAVCISEVSEVGDHVRVERAQDMVKAVPLSTSTCDGLGHWAKLNRSTSLAAGLEMREGSLRKGYRTNGEEGSGRAGRFNRQLELPGRGANADRWAFFTRGISFRSPRVVADSGEGSTSKRSGSKTPVKMP
ncbi:hypothetical protein SASPL_111523 [Salvia splendens]|uniref:Uncharacterized protein n=1 Tax=Salvia splendens TaxID=180675 RepID=A0A8X8Y704_SALSN|nr:hypothetical protein SASPL_111523 [Salvia splendens]